MNTSNILKRRPKRHAPAGVLNAKTLAEENLRGFKIRNSSREQDITL